MFVHYNDVIGDCTEALCILLNRLCYPTRYVGIVPQFGRPVLRLCLI